MTVVDATTYQTTNHIPLDAKEMSLGKTAQQYGLTSDPVVNRRSSSCSATGAARGLVSATVVSFTLPYNVPGEWDHLSLRN